METTGFNRFRNKKPFTSTDFTLAAPVKIHNSLAVMKRYLPLVLVVGLLVAFRVLGSAFPETLPNFQPLAAMFFCGTLLAPGWRGLAIPLGIWAVTFPFGMGHTANPLDFATTSLALLAIFFIGKTLTQRGLPALLLGSALSAVLFHLITCCGAWITDPLYTKNLEGLVQSVWSGPAGSPLPSWVFLRNMTAANVLFTGIFAIAQLRLPNPSFSLSRPLPAKF
ncbi:MAG: hypothetical protein H7Y36_04370 [Armatimonadetes bacterium]|nr:hypothetical protein [Akkermansiaceae bacterium]